MKKERIDKILADRGLADSRSKAQAMIMSGIVLAGEKRVEKPSETYEPDTTLRIRNDGEAHEYVGRGGVKLAKALDEFHICPNGYVCLDIGSSTGGFTDCLLQRGARQVVAIDSGTNQLDWRLRSDPRVDVREKTNARRLEPADFSSKFDLAVMDVSFISVTKIIPAIVPLLTPAGRIITLIKPQFEVGRGEVGKGGIVRDETKHLQVIRRLRSFVETVGLREAGLIDSPILGAKGNKEFLALYEQRSV